MSRAHSKIYWRAHGGVRRAYADLREYADVGGKREALTAEGMAQATADPALAQALYAHRVTTYQQRRLRGVHGMAEPTSLAVCARDYLIAKAGDSITEQWLEGEELRLQRALDF